MLLLPLRTPFLKLLFCSKLSATCQYNVPQGSPIFMCHLRPGWLVYSRNSSSNWDPWPSRIRKGFRPVPWSYTFSSSNAQSMSVRMAPVMLPTEDLLSLKEACWPKRVLFPITAICSYVFMHSSLRHKGVETHTPFLFKNFAAKIIPHITGSPLAAVKPRIVKWLSFVAAHCCGQPLVVHKSFCPPTCASFVWDVFQPHSWTKKQPIWMN